MFKLRINADGSTAVFCKETGDFVCVVAPKNYDHRPAACNPPFPQLLAGASTSSQESVPVPRVCALNFAASSEIDPGRVSPSVESTPDYSNEYISQEEFLQTLNLVPKAKFQSTPLSELKQTFPYRSISRTGEKTFSVPPEEKLYEGLPLSCQLSQKWLQQEGSSRFTISKPEQLMVNLERQSFFCKTILNSNEENSLPRLRNREQKLYPLTYRVCKSWKYLDHMYSFNKTERYERLQTLQTGLNKRGRILLQRCQPLSIKVKPLGKKTIARWTTRPNRMISVQSFHLRRSIGKPFKTWLSNHPGLRCLVQSPERFLSLKSRFEALINHTAVVSAERVDRKKLTASHLFSLRKKKKNPYKCKVLLYNVFWDLSQCSDGCYVQGTSIRVNNVNFLPLVLWQHQSRSLNVRSYDNCSTSSDHEQAYRSSSSVAYSSNSSNAGRSYSQPSHVLKRVSFSKPVSNAEKATCSYVRFGCSTACDKEIPMSDDEHNVTAKPQSFICIDLTKDSDDSCCSSDDNKDRPGDNKISRTCAKGEENETHIQKPLDIITVKEEKTIPIKSKVPNMSYTPIFSASASAKSNAKDSRKIDHMASKQANNSRNAHLNGKSQECSKSYDAQIVPHFRQHSVTNKRVKSSKVCDSMKRGVNVASPKFSHVFRCFSCNYSSSYSTSYDACNSVHKHMTEFHSVSHPESFLKTKVSHFYRNVIIEAFGGFEM